MTYEFKETAHRIGPFDVKRGIKKFMLDFPYRTKGLLMNRADRKKRNSNKAWDFPFLRLAFWTNWLAFVSKMTLKLSNYIFNQIFSAQICKTRVFHILFSTSRNSFLTQLPCKGRCRYSLCNKSIHLKLCLNRGFLVNTKKRLFIFTAGSGIFSCTVC